MDFGLTGIISRVRLQLQRRSIALGGGVHTKRETGGADLRSYCIKNGSSVPLSDLSIHTDDC